ncbi:hypothetical protein Bca52824_037689 [Brassica carinata]|uniref:SSD domain-containing protein n=1 Tax=Brassica carinata TaxID=52824 RepID=A0A8X7RMU3_BRACI|nr:hypothetical protein Bca52824_037689 [Brassica carinata]
MRLAMISFSVLVNAELISSLNSPIHSNDYCAMYDICGQRTDGKVLNCPYGSPSVKPDDLFSAKIQSLCPTIAGNVCCTETQFDTLRSQVQQAVPFLVGCPACLRNFLNLFCELSCSPNQSLFINVTSVAEVGGNLTVDGIDYHITDMFGEGLYESCKEVKFGTMNTRAINFVGGGAQNFREWFAFIGQKAPPGFPGSPYAINFRSSSPELSAMAPMNLSTYSCGDTSLGCSCGDCPSSPACSSPEPLPHMKKTPAHFESVLLRCIELSMALLYILLVSSFFGWATFSRTRDITQPDGSSESLVHLLEGDGINSELKENTLGVKVKRHAHLSPVQRYMASFYKSYGSWIARNPSLVLFISVAIVLALSSGLFRFKVETRPEKLWVGPSSKAAEEKKFFDSHLSPFYRIEQLILATVPDPKTGKAPRIVTEENILCFLTYKRSISRWILEIMMSMEELSMLSIVSRRADPSAVLGGFSGSNYSEVMVVAELAWSEAFGKLSGYVCLYFRHAWRCSAVLYFLHFIKGLARSFGVVLVLLSVLGSIGFFSAVGVKSTLIIMEVIPFLVLAVGVDNMCILVRAVKRQPRDISLEDRISSALVEVGPSITLASLSEVLAFAVGAFVPMPACRIFSMFAALAILLDFFLQITAFVALIVFDCKRAADNRIDCFPCVKVSSSSQESVEGGSEPGFLERYMKEVHAPVLGLWVVKMVVVAVFLAFALASIALSPRLETGLEQKIVLPRDSYLQDYFDSLAEYLRVGPPLYFVVKDYNYSLESRHTNQLCSISQCNSNSLLNEISRASQTPETSYIAKPAASWLDDFLVWLSPEAFGCCRKFTNGSYCPPDDQPPCCTADDDICSLDGICRDCTTCFRHSDLVRDRPSTAQFREKLPWFLNALPSADCAKGGHGAYTNSVDLKGYETGVIQASEFRTYHTPLNTQGDYVNSLRAAREFSSRMSNLLKIEIFPYSVFYIFFEQYLNIWTVALTNLAIAIGAIFVVCLLITSSAWSSAIIVLVLVMILADLMGVMVVLGIQLNAVSVVNLIMSIGIAVEFCVHISHAFLMSNGNREQRARKALETMGASVFSGITLTKLVGVMVLCFARSEIFVVYYFQMYLALVIIGFLHGLVFLPVILSLAGPPQIYLDTEEEEQGRDGASSSLLN